MKKYLPHLIAVAAFLILTVAFFAPLFGGKELKQQDINNWKGMSNEIVTYHEKSGESTLWTNSMFGGMPAYQISVVYGANLLQYVDKVVTLGLPAPASYLFLFMVGFYFLLLTLKVDPRVAVIGAIGFAFSSYFLIIIDAGHNSKAHAIGYMAPIVAGILLAYRGRMILGAAITGIALGLQLYANHLQITYYTMLMVIILLLVELYSFIKEKKIGEFIKISAVLAVVAVLAGLSNITNLWATQEYGKYSTRGPSELTANKENQTTGLDRDYITDWSYGVGESMTLVIPDFKGGASEAISSYNKDALKNVDTNFRQYVGNFGAYFGDQPFTSGPTYAGAVLILLFVIGLFVVKGPVKWWLAAATVLSLLLSWGRNFMGFTNFFLDHVPGYDKFRAVAMILVIAEFTIPLLAILAVDQMIKEADFYKVYGKKLLTAIGIVGGITLLIAISPGTFTSFYSQKEYDQVLQSLKGQQGAQETVDQFFSAVSEARRHIVVSDAERSFGFILLAAVLIWTFARYRYKKEYFVYGLMFLVLIDLAVVDRRFISSDDFVKKTKDSAPWEESTADLMMKPDTTQSYRVLNIAVNTFNDASTSYYHQSIGGYHGAKLKRYKELIDYSLTVEMSRIRTALQSRDSNAFSLIVSQPALNMLNTKYIIVQPDLAPLQNTGALGNSWFVNETKIVENADSEIAAIAEFNPKTTVIIDKRYSDKLTGMSPSSDTSATIVLTKYKPNDLTYSSKSSTERIAVFSEIFYDKGWNAYVDGKKSDYFRADYVLRAMRIPSGTHTVEWKFEPEVYTTGERISFAGSLALLLVMGMVVYTEVKKFKKAA